MLRKIFILIMSLLLILSQIAPVTAEAKDTFTQNDWTGGAQPAANAQHSANDTGWNKYSSSLDSYIYKPVPGAVTQSAEPLSVVDTKDTDFQKGIRDKVNVSGSGQNASLVLQAGLEDPFVNNLGQWTSLPEIPHLDWWSAYARVTHPTGGTPPIYDGKIYIYALWSGKTFGRFSAENGTWQILADTPNPFGFGAALAYPPGGGDFIYATRGAGTKEFWKYSISNDTWTRIAYTNWNVGAGGSIAAYNNNNIYCVAGCSTQKFMVYSISADNWTDLSISYPTPFNVDRQGSLVYPGSGEYVYLSSKYSNPAVSRYHVTAPGWSTVNNAPVNISDMCYPGSGDYLYAWTGDDSSRGFARLNSKTNLWENLTNIARLPAYPYRAILYDPGTGTKLKWLSTGNYSKTFNFDTSVKKWDEPSGAMLYGGGCDMVSDGTYIYASNGGWNSGFWRYDPSANVWNPCANMSFPATSNSSLTFLNNKVYSATDTDTNGVNFASYDVVNKEWTPLTNQPLPARMGYGSQICAVGNYIYALRGRDPSTQQLTNTFYRYDPTTGWTDDETVAKDLPDTVDMGASLVYPGVPDEGGNYFIYATKGGSTRTAWKYCVTPGPGSSYTANTWTQIADAPFITASQGRLVYPGSGDYIYIFPGYVNLFGRYRFRTTDASDTRSVNTWEILGPTPFVQGFSYGACALANKIYAGSSDDYTLYIYDISTKKWSQRYKDTYSPSYGRIVYTGGDFVYMFYGNYTSHIWEYSISQKRWMGLIRAQDSGGNPILLKPGTKACYPGSGNYIYVIEGNTNYFWRYDYVNNVWAPMSGPEVSPAVPLIFYSGSQLDGKGDVLYACQGREESNSVDSQRSYKFLTYTISSNTWRVSGSDPSLPALPASIYQYHETGNKLVHVPGANKLYWMNYGDTALRIYDINSGSWSTTASAPLEMAVVAASGSCLYYRQEDNSIYVFSGEYSNTFSKYSIDSNSWTELPTYGRGMSYGVYDVDAFYPGGDFLYFFDSAYNYFNRYSLSQKDWDLPVTLPYSTYYPVFSAGADGDSLYYGTYYDFYRYNISARSWLKLNNPYTALGWRWDEYSAQLVYFPGDRDSLFATRGRTRNDFARYSISQDKWIHCRSPGNFGVGHCLVATPYKIYALMGGLAPDFYSYDTYIDYWTPETALSFPAAVGSGSAMVYVPTKNTIYALQGNYTTGFYKLDLSSPTPQWLPEEPAPVSPNADCAGISLVYPGSGDYIYLLLGTTYSYWGETASFYRFSITNKKWEDQQSAPAGMRGCAKIVYPGKGNYFYALRGIGYPDIFKYLLFKEGTYTSEKKCIGRHSQYDSITWSDTGDGYFEFRARTADNPDMNGAAGWDSVPVRKKGDPLSDSYPVIQDTHEYFQYQMKFITDDLSKLPTLNDLTINYEKYRARQEIISSAYDSGYQGNRLTKLSWTETLPPQTQPGADIRFQIKTASTMAGLDDPNNHFLGPAGTQTFNDDYSTEGNYSYAPTIEVLNGKAALKRILNDYLYTQRIVLDNSTGSKSYTDFVVLVTIDSSNDHFWSNVRKGGEDFRFVDQNGIILRYNSTDSPAKFDYDNKTAQILVQVPSVIAGSKTIIYLKYGNPDLHVSSASDHTVIGQKISSVAAYDQGDSGDYDAGTKAVAVVFANDINGLYDDAISGYPALCSFNTNILTKNVIFLSGRSSSEIITALNNGAIAILNVSSYYGLRSSLGITNDSGICASRGFSTPYFAYKTGYALCASETDPMGCDWEHWTPEVISNRALNFIDTISSLPNVGVNGSNLYLGLMVKPTYFTLYMDKAASSNPALSAWGYSNEIEINNLHGGALTNYQIKIQLTNEYEDFWARCRNDGFDVRFVDSDNKTILNAYRLSFDPNNKSASFWVNVPAIPAGDTKSIYLYYGNSGAADLYGPLIPDAFNTTFTKDFGEKGYNASAVSLNGTTDKVTVQSPNSLNTTSAFTLEADVKYTADTWLPGFSYRKTVALDNTASATNFVNTLARFNVGWVSGMKADFSDIRFVDTDGSKLRYNIESHVNNNSATVLVEVPSIPAHTSKNICLYYGADTTGEEDASLKAMPPDGLIGYWKFDEGTGTTALDSSLSNRTGTGVNPGQWVDGIVKKALSMTDKTGVKIPYTFAGLNDFTMAAWVYIKGTHGAYSGAIMSSGSWNSSHWGFCIRSDNKTLEFRNNFTTTSQNYLFYPNAWYHVCAVRSGTTLNFYINGSSAGSSACPGNALQSADNVLPNTTMIGRETYSDGYFYFNGIIDEPVIYNRALSPNEVLLVSEAVMPCHNFTVTFADGPSAPSIDSTIIGKLNAYELKFTQSGLTGLINGNAILSTPNYATGNFANFAFTYDGLSKARLVVDGVEKASADLAPVVINTNANGLVIGEKIKGAIDEVRIWNIARKVGSLLEDKEKCLNDNESGLICYLRFNENSGTSAADATGNGNNGTTPGTWLLNPFSYSNGMPSALYHMDGNANDSSENGNNLTNLYNTSWSSTDLTGFSRATDQSLSFNATSSYASAPDTNSLDVTGKISLEAWIKPTGTSGDQVILFKGDNYTATPKRWNYKLYLSGNRLAFSICNSSGAESAHTANSSTIVAGTTYHVVVTFDEETHKVRMYINNVEQTLSSDTENNNMIPNNDALRLGKDTAPGSTSYRGLIDEVRIYRRILTPDEVKNHYEHRLATITEPDIYNVYAPPPPTQNPDLYLYTDNNPTIQPNLGVFYTNKNLMRFQVTPSSQVSNTDIKYQVSNNGYTWYWFNNNKAGGPGWEQVTGGYSQTNTANEIDANLAAFQNMDGFSEGDFYYRAYLHSEPSSYRTPYLDNVAITLFAGDSYYTDPLGATAINTFHSDANNDRWFQYKAILYSEGEKSPVLNQVNVEFTNTQINITNPPAGGVQWNVGETYPIKWESVGLEGTMVRIDYSTDGVNWQEGYICPNVSVGNFDNGTGKFVGSFNWYIENGKYTPTANAKIRVVSLVPEFNGNIYGESDIFKIFGVLLDSPLQNQVWEINGPPYQTINCAWRTSGLNPANDRLRLVYSYGTNSSEYTIADDIAASPSDSYPWSLDPAQQGYTGSVQNIVRADDNVYIKVFVLAGENPTGIISSVKNSFVPKPQITFDSINGLTDGKAKSGDTLTIGWHTNTQMLSKKVNIFYSPKGDFTDSVSIATGAPSGVPDTTTAPNTPCSGSYSWNITSSTPVSGSGMVKIEEFDVPSGRFTGTKQNTVSQAFSIIAPTITVSGPGGTDEWVVGDTETITWSADGTLSGNFKIEYSTDDFNSNIYTIATLPSIAPTGGVYKYTWTVGLSPSDHTVIPDAGLPIKIRVADNQLTGCSGTSAQFHIFTLSKLDIIQPNGGETLIQGKPYTVKWKATGKTLLTENGGNGPSVKLYYTSEYGVESYTSMYSGSRTTFDADPSGMDNVKYGTYTWTPNKTSKAPGAKIKVVHYVNGAEDPSIQKESESTFTISNPTVTLTSPNGGETIYAGGTYPINWTTEGTVGTGGFKIQYSADGTFSSPVDIIGNYSNTSDTGGSYSWQVNQAIAGSAKIRIIDNVTPTISDVSDGSFTIANPSITLGTIPGQKVAGTKLTIPWQLNGVTQSAIKNVTIQYIVPDIDVQNGVENWNAHSPIYSVDQTTSSPATGSFDWTVPASSGGRGYIGRDCKIRIFDNKTGTVTGDTKTFMITAPNITVGKPGVGDKLIIGDTSDIIWYGIGEASNAWDITCAYEGAAAPKVIAANTSLTSSQLDPGDPQDAVYITGGFDKKYVYHWQVPADLQVSKDASSASINIRDTNNPTVAASSTTFYLNIPQFKNITMAFQSDTTGSLFTVKDPVYIKWDKVGSALSNTVKIEYYKSDAGAWAPVIASTNNTGSYAWQLPDNSNLYSIQFRITEVSNITTRPKCSRSSDEAYNVLPYPAITMDTPAASGEIWRRGTTHDITWHKNIADFSNRFLLYYSTDNGISWNVFTNTAGDPLPILKTQNSYTWTIPDNAVVSAQYKFRLVDDGSGRTPQPEGVSANALTVDYPIITITYPSGPVYWAKIDKPVIRWTNEGKVADPVYFSYNQAGVKSDQYTIPNNNAYTWTIPGALQAGVCNIQFIDTNDSQHVKSAEVPVNIINAPIITLTSPNGGAEYEVGANVPITWTSQGLSIYRVSIDYSNDDGAFNVINTKNIASNLSNDSQSYSWTIPGDVLTGKQVRVRIRAHDHAQGDSRDPADSVFEISDMSDANFRIKAGFDFTLPAGNEFLVAKSPYTIKWNNRGSTSSANLEFSKDGGTTWQPIATVSPNNGSYDWTVPDIFDWASRGPNGEVPDEQIKLRVSNAADPTEFKESNPFNIVYATVEFHVKDQDAGTEIPSLSMSESSGYKESPINSPIKRVKAYSYGDYVTSFEQKDYVPTSATWTTYKNFANTDSVQIVTVQSETIFSAQATWEAKLTYTYDTANNNTLTAVGSLQKRGKLIGVIESDRAKLGSAELKIYDPADTTTPKYDLTVAGPDSNAMYTFVQANAGFEPGKVYPATITIKYSDNPFTSSTSIVVTAEIQQKQLADQLAASTNTIVGAVNTTAAATQALVTSTSGTTQQLVTDTKKSIEEKVEATKSELKADTTRILTATEQTIPTQITQKVETVLRSEILNRESVVRIGTDLTIRYRVPANANSMPIIDVYNPNNAKVINASKMAGSHNVSANAMLPGMSIYEYKVHTSGWIPGDYTIICSDPASGTMDALMISVLRTDLEDIAGQVGTIMGTTTSLANLKDVADTLNSQFSIIESALGKISTDLVNKVKEVASNASDIESVYTQLVNIGKELKTLGASQDVNLSKLLEVSKEKKQDMLYLKNKTQELKAVMDINQKMIDNMAHKPVTQTWFEYK